MAYRLRRSWFLLLLLTLVVIGIRAGEESPEMTALLKEFRRLDRIARLIQDEYAEPISREQIWEGAFSGMVTTLDPASRFIPRQELLLRCHNESGGSSGFGFDWRPDPANDRIAIARVLPGGPADLAGMVRGDALEAVGETRVAGLTLVRLRETMLAIEDNLGVTIRHADGLAERFTLKRATYEDNGVAAARWLDRRLGIGCVAIHRFVHGETDRKANQIEAATVTGRAFRAEIDRLANDGLRALTIDLRGNGGGSLLAAVEVADCFLNATPQGENLIVATVSRNPAHQARFVAHSANTYPPWPLALLVDRDSASAAEVLAAALRENQRAVIVGSPTQGKDTVQQRFLLDDGSALLLTVAHYRTPSGQNLTGRGMQPDVAVPQGDRELLALDRWRRNPNPDAAPPIDQPVQRAIEVLTAVCLLRGEAIVP